MVICVHIVEKKQAVFLDTELLKLKAKFHYAILVADRSEAGPRPAAGWNLAYHLAR